VRGARKEKKGKGGDQRGGRDLGLGPNHVRSCGTRGLTEWTGDPQGRKSAGIGGEGGILGVRGEAKATGSHVGVKNGPCGMRRREEVRRTATRVRWRRKRVKK